MKQADRQDESNTEKEITLVDLASVLAKRKRLVVGLPFVVGLLTALGSLLLPVSYTSTTRILPPQQNQSSSALLLSQLGSLLVAGPNSPLSLKNSSDLFAGMLKSRTVADRLIDRFRLRELYEVELLHDAREVLARRTNITVSRDGLIRIDVEDRDPQRAAAIANAYVEELRRLLTNLAIGEAGSRRVFFEQHLRKAKDDLTTAEVSLSTFQRRTNLLDPQSQAGLTVATAASLRAQIAAKQVQISALRSFATEHNPELVRTEQEIESLRKQLAKLESDARTGRGDVLLSIDTPPNLVSEFLQKFREVKYHETLYELLAKQYEIARIDEAKDAAIVQVVDEAVPPERKSWPNRTRLVLLTVFVTGLLSIVVAILFRADGQTPPTTRTKLIAVLREFANWRK
jgi:uncharacterized protein involved in exopolysaccharide biosynthesis